MEERLDDGMEKLQEIYQAAYDRYASAGDAN